MANREEGFYWVRKGDEWMIAHWEYDVWYVASWRNDYDDDYFDEIDENKLVRK